MLLGGWRLLLWAGELSGSVGNSNWWAPSRRSQATGDNQLRTRPTLEDDGGRSPITGRTIRDVTREKSGIPEEHLSTLLDPRSQVGC